MKLNAMSYDVSYFYRFSCITYSIDAEVVQLDVDIGVYFTLLCNLLSHCVLQYSYSNKEVDDVDLLSVTYFMENYYLNLLDGG